MKLLLVEDEQRMAQALSELLRLEHYEVKHCADGIKGRDAAVTEVFDLMILDVMLPGISGFEIARQVREKGIRTPILMLTAKSEIEDKVMGLDRGADDYLTKPFHNGELLARIRSAIRSIREEKDQSAILSFGDLTIDMLNHCVKKKNEIIKLTSTEFSILSLMAQNAGKVLTHQYLLKEVWGVAYQSQPQYLRVFIAQLRKKIENDPSFPAFILTESGIGYRFSEQTEK